MTNLEWLKERITADDLVEIWIDENAPWCDANSICSSDFDCTKCIKKWCEKEYVVPMPKLQDGTFVKCGFEDDSYFGIVIKSKGCICYQDGDFSYFDTVPIIAVYDNKIRCFNQCTEDHIIWRKPND